MASTRALSELGGFSTNCQRDYISFAADVMPVDAKAALNVVQDVALNGCFDIDEVDNAVASYAAELKEGLARDVDLQVCIACPLISQFSVSVCVCACIPSESDFAS